MDQQPLELYEPSSRLWNVSCSSDGQLIMWGGETSEFYSSIHERKKLASVLQQFDPSTELWRQRETRGIPHPGLPDAARTLSGNYLYFYGGYTGERHSGVLSCLDVNTLTWSLLCPETAGGPMRKGSCGMVLFNNNKLAVIGGYGTPTGPTQAVIRDSRFTDGRGWSNEFHVFDISQGLLSSPTLRGTRPPHCADFTLTSIDSLHAVMFGGYQPQRGTVSDLYLIDFNTMEITKVEPGEGEPWPTGRDCRAACCLGYPGDNTHLLIMGGSGRDGKPLNDMWLFDLPLKKWKEVTLPDGILPRRLHSATAIILCPGLVEVIVFGGTSDDHVDGKPPQSYTRLAETTIFSFGKLGSEWVLVGVATNNLRGSSERVQDKMILKSGVVPLFDRDSLVTTYGLYRLERGGIPVWGEISNKNRDFQALLRQKQRNSNLVMIKWLNREQKANIKPTWKNLFLVLRLLNLDDLAEKMEAFMSGTTESEGGSVSKQGEFDSVLTMASLTQLERGVGIPVLSELEAKNHEFQAIIRVKQHNVSGAINKWLSAPVLSRIVPTWKNFLSVLCLICLDNVAHQIETYLSKHPPSTLESEGDQGGEIEVLRKENVVLRQQLSDRDETISDLDETISDLKHQIEASEATIKMLKETDHSKLSTAPKESTTIPSIQQTDPTLFPVPSPMPARPKPLPLSVKAEQGEKALWMMPAEDSTMVGHPSSILEQKTTHIKTEHFATSEAEIQGLNPPQPQAQTPELTPASEMAELKPTLLQPTAAGFRGVEVCAETTVLVTNSPQTFVWQGYGLKLNIPKGSLPAEMDEATINIQASLSGQYEFPENSHLVSAVFWMCCKPRCRFTVPISMEIQHCARPKNIGKLGFVKASCSQASLPYTFRRLAGRFTSSCSYGVLELDSFSGTAVTQEGSEDREYIARLFYLNQTISTYEIHLVVTWNIEAYLTVVKREYHEERQALPGPVQPVDFESDQIKLDIPPDGTTIKGGWIITPLTAPVVMKRYVDKYQPGKWIPSCELAAQYKPGSTDTKPVPLCYRMKLLGAKEPHNMFTIIPPMAGARYGTHHSAMGQSSASTSSASKRSLEVDQSEGLSLKKSRTVDPQPQTGAAPKLQTLVQEDTNVPAQVLPLQREPGAAVGDSVPQAYQPSHSLYNKEMGLTHGIGGQPTSTYMYFSQEAGPSTRSDTPTHHHSQISHTYHPQFQLPTPSIAGDSSLHRGGSSHFSQEAGPLTQHYPIYQDSQFSHSYHRLPTPEGGHHQWQQATPPTMQHLSQQSIVPHSPQLQPPAAHTAGGGTIDRGGSSPKAMDISPHTRTPSNSCGRDTAEYRTIIRCTPALRTAVEHHLTHLSGHLLAKYLITSEQDVELRNRTLTECERAASLVRFVAGMVEQNSVNYHSFIDIL